MKVYALGHRAKWKDYVDLYFILKDHCTLSEVCARAQDIFGVHFNTKLLREQLCYFEDINYSESVIYVGQEIDDQDIKDFLCDVATTAF